MISRAAKRGSLRRLGLLALVLASLGLAPTASLAALPSVTATSASSSPLPQLPPALEEVERKQEASASCSAFCVEPLELALDGRLGSGKASVDTQDAWGVFRNPDAPDGPFASKNRFAFTGYVFDPETELYFAKARFYDPTVGRFTSQDSFLGDIDAPPSLHRYFYAHANPARFTDPTGTVLASLAATKRSGGWSTRAETSTLRETQRALRPGSSSTWDSTPESNPSATPPRCPRTWCWALATR